MSRQTGSANLSASIEPLAGAPLDARSIVPTLADLTVGSNFPYKYIGMEVYVVAEDKKYRLINMDTTSSTSWKEIGEGGGTGGGHIIENDGTDLTQRDTLNFVDMSATDDDTNEKTQVSPHRLTNAELQEIVDPIPNAATRLPVLFDERGTEYQIGWYVNSNGLRKPIYQKSFAGLNVTPAYNAWTHVVEVSSLNIDVLHVIGINSGTSNTITGIGIEVYYNSSSKYIDAEYNVNSNLRAITELIIQYTKTTDSFA